MWNRLLFPETVADAIRIFALLSLLLLLMSLAYEVFYLVVLATHPLSLGQAIELTRVYALERPMIDGIRCVAGQFNYYHLVQPPNAWAAPLISGPIFAVQLGRISARADSFLVFASSMLMAGIVGLPLVSLSFHFCAFRLWSEDGYRHWVASEVQTSQEFWLATWDFSFPLLGSAVLVCIVLLAFVVQRVRANLIA